MQSLSLLYIIRVILGLLAAAICALYNYFFSFSFTISDLLRGLTIAIAFYLITYYVLKIYFLSKVEKPRKIISTGIGAYFITWIVIWSLLSTMLLNETNIVYAVQGFKDFEIRKMGNANGDLNGLLWADSNNSSSQVQAIKGFLPHGLGDSKSLNNEINMWRDTETFPNVLFLKLNITEISLSCNTSNGYVAFGIALWLALDESSYSAVDSNQLVVRFQNTTKYENNALIVLPELQYSFNDIGHNFNFSITNIPNGYKGLVEIDLGPKFKQVFERQEMASIRVAKLKGVEIYIGTIQGTCSVKISDVQIYLKGLTH